MFNETTRNKQKINQRTRFVWSLKYSGSGLGLGTVCRGFLSLATFLLGAACRGGLPLPLLLGPASDLLAAASSSFSLGAAGFLPRFAIARVSRVRVWVWVWVWAGEREYQRARRLELEMEAKVCIRSRLVSDFQLCVNGTRLDEILNRRVWEKPRREGTSSEIGTDSYSKGKFEFGVWTVWLESELIRVNLKIQEVAFRFVPTWNGRSGFFKEYSATDTN